jgi:hypothetical protein
MTDYPQGPGLWGAKGIWGGDRRRPADAAEPFYVLPGSPGKYILLYR